MADFATGEGGLFGHYYDRPGFREVAFRRDSKAHPLVMDIFLQIPNAGRFTLANGETLVIEPPIKALAHS